MRLRDYLTRYSCTYRYDNDRAFRLQTDPLLGSDARFEQEYGRLNRVLDHYGASYSAL